jgi:dTDP-glucose pyrophosphorylase
MFEVGLIPAAGEGLRLYPYSKIIPKTLFEIGGKSLLQRNLEIMRDKLGIKKVYIIIGYLGEMIKNKFGNGSDLGMKIEYIECKNVRAGLAKGIYLAKNYIKTNFVVILGDEFYLNSNHEELSKFLNMDYTVVCGVKITGDTTIIKKNYSLNIEDGMITSLQEKPNIVENNFAGCGTYLFTPLVFDYIEKTKPSYKTGRIELTDVINNIAQDKSKVFPFFLKGEYTNVNTFDDLNAATYIYRAAMLKDYKVSLIIPAYNEEASIGVVIDEFKDMVDEVIVIENCSEDKTALIAKERGAKVISKKLEGYGDALKQGMDNATGDIFILVEADASFKAHDLPKILEYLKDADMVIGTRTTRQMIEQGANMDVFLRWGNVFAAKIVELLWWSKEPRFTDLGCTYRGIWKDAYLTIRDNLKSKGPEFSPEMMIEILRANKKIIEIPVTYRPRIGGISKHSSSKLNILKTGLKMMKLVLRKRFNF